MTPEDYNVIERHLQPLIKSCETSIAALDEVKTPYGALYTSNQKRYWRHCRAGLRWALGLAKQQRDAEHGRRSGTV